LGADRKDSDFSTQSMAWRDREHGETPPGTKELAGIIPSPGPQHLATLI